MLPLLFAVLRVALCDEVSAAVRTVATCSGVVGGMGEVVAVVSGDAGLVFNGTVAGIVIKVLAVVSIVLNGVIFEVF